MKPARGNAWLGGVVALVLATSAWGQSVHVVAGDGSGDFLQLESAVNNAANGDVILVRPHTERYEFTTIDDKSLTIVGDGDVRPEVEDVRVIDLGPNRVVILRFLDILGRSEPNIFPFGGLQRDGLELSNNDGCVWLEDLVVAGANGIPKLGSFETGLKGLVVVNSDCVVVVDSDASGGAGGHSVGGSSWPGGDGGSAFLSAVALHGGTFLGGTSGFAFGAPAVQGGTGLDSAASTVFASGSSLTGGDTGDNFGGPPSLDPSASGLLARDTSSVNHLASTFTPGGGPAPPGDPITSIEFSTVEDLDDSHRAIKISAPIREQEMATLTYTGQPDDLLLLQISALPDWSLLTQFKGVRHLGGTALDLFIVNVGPTGVLGFIFEGPVLPPGTDGAAVFAQPIVAESGGGLRIGSPTTLIVVDASIPAP